jgi:hypothetical protein
MADVGLAAFCENVDTVTLERLTQQFEALVADRERHGAAVAARVDAMTARLKQALHELDLMPAER